LLPTRAYMTNRGDCIFFKPRVEQYNVSSAEPGLVVVFEGKRTRVRVFRRFFYPVQVKDEDVEVVVYSDTGQEREVTYKRAEDFDLDNPLKLVAMIRLAYAMKVLRPDKSTNGVQNLRLTICKSRELIGPDAERNEWMPFDPTRMRPLDERIKDAKKRARWKQRLRTR
jgi:hypothetical protein